MTTISTLTLDDSYSILAIDRKYLDPDRDLLDVTKMLHDVGVAIGIRVDGAVRGYARVIFGRAAKILWFDGDLDFKEPLYRGVEAIIIERGGRNVTVTVSISGFRAEGRVNFWYSCGFVATGIDIEATCMHMKKVLT